MMIQNRNDMDAFKKSIASALDDPALNCYAIVDSAQDPTLVARFESESLSMENACLLPAARGNDEIVAMSPHLVALSPLAADADGWDDILAVVARKPATLTLMASPLGFEALLEHLESFTEVFCRTIPR